MSTTIAPANLPTEMVVHLPDFDGPLDLLLHLVRQNRVDIFDIPIAEITDRYLEVIRSWERMDLEIASEYLVMSATLIEIKSRMLLPKPPRTEPDEEGQDPRAELVAKLVEYSRYRGLVETLQAWEEDRRQLFFRTTDPDPADYELPIPDGQLNPQWLAQALDRVLARAVDTQPSQVIMPRKRVTLRLRMVEVLRRALSWTEQQPFDALFDGAYTRWDVLVTFLSVLELMRQNRIGATQDGPLAPVYLWAIQEQAA